MKLPNNAFPVGYPNYGRNNQIIGEITIHKNELVDHTLHDKGKLIHWKIGTKNGLPILVNPENCEWLSQTFFRNEDTLFGFSLIEKGKTTKMYLTPIKTKVDFETFTPLGENYAKDKNNYYYGPGGVVIQTDSFALFFDETYKEEWNKLHPTHKTDPILSLWKTKIATSQKEVFWKGKIAKGVHPSLKRITNFHFADNYQVYEYDLQKIKKIEGVDRSSLVYFNSITSSNAIKSLICDKHKPLHCYVLNKVIDKQRDYKNFKPLFDAFQGQLNTNYWWEELHKAFNP